ncbi:hypothetical protein B0F90DRAFT_1770069, partial [Multifurca ochricompacta]
MVTCYFRFIAEMVVALLGLNHIKSHLLLRAFFLPFFLPSVDAKTSLLPTEHEPNSSPHRVSIIVFPPPLQITLLVSFCFKGLSR